MDHFYFLKKASLSTYSDPLFALCDLTAISASSGGCFSLVNKADALLAVRPAALCVSAVCCFNELLYSVCPRWISENTMKHRHEPILTFSGLSWSRSS